ncbi:MAG TPA: divalent-cation tolerance protein CutA [Thiolapillus brandeum]|uniref:Divalent-cation tolerance protein CutA n=1 Tax=Thiolapillus brandeum TaxID=1076588 RepID=A0A831KBX3_9GAMM|nr:divalent-cation tolerance protein CutA [Thiolapillus brandeum]
MNDTCTPVSFGDNLTVFCTCPDDSVAQTLALALVEKKLAACVNIINSIKSVYRWQGEIQQDTEVLLTIKTTTNGWGKLQQALLELHPYDVPEIIALPIVAGNKDYLSWVGENVCTD